MTDTFFRPPWTCGRYNKDNKVAIFYNNITGYSYFFEEVSAIIIGEVLSVERNSIVDVNEISNAYPITKEQLVSFFDELTLEGLLVKSIQGDLEIGVYRDKVRKWRLSQTSFVDQPLEEKLYTDFSTAEKLYDQKAGAVTSVMFELTYRCSEMCIHCYNIGATRNNQEVSHRGSLDELSLDEYKRVIDELYALGMYKITFSGGDPFSNKYAWELIEYVYQKNIAISIFTNGLSIDSCKKLADYYPRVIGISIYSGLPEVHDYITRVKGSWNRSMSVISQLSELSVPLEIKCCIMQPNFKSYYTIYEICRKYGAAPQLEVSITDSIEGDQCARDLRLSPEQLEVVLRDENLKLYVGKEIGDRGGGERLMSENACGAGETTFCLTPDGDLIPCCAFHLSFGNVREQSVSEILKSSKNKKYWNILTLEDYEECGRYDYCNYCNLCAGVNYSEHGVPTKAGENNCYTAKVRYGLASKLKQGDDPLMGKSLEERISMFLDYQPINLERKIMEKKIVLTESQFLDLGKKAFCELLENKYLLSEANVLDVYKKLVNNDEVPEDELKEVQKRFRELLDYNAKERGF